MKKLSHFLFIFILLVAYGSPYPSDSSSIFFIAPQTQIQPAVPVLSTLPPLEEDALEVVMVSPEADPFSKAGGMGDYLLGLTTALRNEGQKVTVISPLFQTHKGDEAREISKRQELIEKYKIRKMDGVIEVYVGSEKIPLEVYTTELKGVRHYFLDHPFYFKRLYSGETRKDMAIQSILLSRGSLQLMQALNLRPDIIQTNDWMAAPTLTFLKTDPQYANSAVFEKTKTTHVIHNSGLGYQGEFKQDVLPLFNLTPMHQQGLLHQFPNGGVGVNLTAAVLKHHADHVITVSNGFRNETLTHEFAQGIEGYLQERLRKNQYHGIVNGTDLSGWLQKLNAVGSKEAAKKALIDSFSSRTDERRLLQTVNLNQWKALMPEFIALRKGERRDPRKLQTLEKILRTGAALNIKPEAPVMGMVTRITWQKGIELVLDNIRQSLDANPELAFVFLGSGEPVQELQLKQLEFEYPGRVSVTIDFDAKLADKIYLGADMFLMPSKYEPCGIAQLNAMAVGTIPIVSATGGLEETVNQFNAKTGVGAGVKFENFDRAGFQWAINRAVTLYKDKILWGQMMANARRRALTYTWENSARDYMRTWRWMLKKDPVLASDKIKKPSAALYENPRRPDLKLDAWDQENYFWDEASGYWRSKAFPRLVLGTWEDIQANQDRTNLVNHIAIRMRAGWTLYVVNDSKWALAYLQEAKLRGELPPVGNQQIYISEKPAHVSPETYPDTEALVGKSDLEKLQYYWKYVTGTPNLNEKANAILAHDGTLLHHYWIDQNGEAEKVRRFAPLADGKTLFYGVSPERFLSMHRGGEQRTGIIHIGKASGDQGYSLGHLLGFLNRLQAESLTPSSIIISNLGSYEEDRPLERMRELAKRIPEEVFPEENLVRSLDRPASIGYWHFAFERLFKRYPGDRVRIQLSYDQGLEGIFNEEIEIPGILLEEKNRYLVARYLGSIIYNRAVTEGAKRVGIEIKESWLKAQIVKLLKKELENYPSDLGNFGQAIPIVPGLLVQERSAKEALELYKKPVNFDQQGVSIGFHVSQSGMNLVAVQNGEIVFKRGNSTHPIHPIETSGQALQKQILDVLDNFLKELEKKEIYRSQISSIGFSFPGPVHRGKTLRWINFEQKWLESTDDLDKEYEAINALKEIIPDQFGIRRVAFLNSADAHGLAEIKAHNGTMLKDAVSTQERVRIVLKISQNGVGYAKIKNGLLDDRPNEGGHLSVRIVNPHLQSDGCGNAGCLEQFVKEDSIRKMGSIFKVDWANGEFKLDKLFEQAGKILKNLQKISELQLAFERKEPIELSEITDERAVVAYQALNSLADLYADAIERFLILTKANQIILSGNLIYLDKEDVLIKLIRERFKAKYQDRFPEQVSDPDFITRGRADTVFGASEGAALYAITVPQVSPLEAPFEYVGSGLEAAI